MSQTNLSMSKIDRVHAGGTKKRKTKVRKGIECFSSTLWVFFSLRETSSFLSPFAPEVLKPLSF